VVTITDRVAKSLKGRQLEICTDAGTRTCGVIKKVVKTDAKLELTIDPKFIPRPKARLNQPWRQTPRPGPPRVINLKDVQVVEGTIHESGVANRLVLQPRIIGGVFAIHSLKSPLLNTASGEVLGVLVNAPRRI
jgi:hypothetical protein